MRPSLSLSTPSASPSALYRFSHCWDSARRLSWLPLSSTSQSIHSPESPSSRIGALSEASPPSRRFHIDHVLLRHAQTLGDELDLIRPHIAFVERGDAALRLPQIEEQLFLVGGGAHLHQRPGAQDVFLDRRLDPPHGVSRQPEALLGLESVDRLHQADIALGNDFRDRQAI